MQIPLPIQKGNHCLYTEAKYSFKKNEKCLKVRFASFLLLLGELPNLFRKIQETLEGK